MNVHRELFLRGTSDALRGCIAEIESNLDNGWSRDYQSERQVPVSDMVCFRCQAGPSREAACLWIARKHEDGSVLYVPNIVPSDKNSISREEYNRILEEFTEHYVVPAAGRIGVRPELTKCDKGLEDWLSTEAAQALRFFTKTTNRSSGSSHPNDRERWFRFIVAAHLERSSLDSSILRRWLEEEDGWREEMAAQIASEYSDAREILEYYDRVR